MPVWELVVYNPDGSLRGLLTPDDPVDEIRWATRGDGDCLEAEIIGRGLDLRPRDVVCIRTVNHSAHASIPLARYWGWVMESGGVRSPGLTSTRLVGGSQRLRETLNTLGRMPPYLDTDTWDVGLSARDVIRIPTMPPLLYSLFGVYAPEQGFVHGVRSPHLETVAESLDALAAMVPGFTVSSGSSYTYNNVTYTPGQEVPATTWGVRASVGFLAAAIVFFRREDGLVVIDEVADKAVVTWSPLSAEGVVDRVQVVLFDAPLDETRVVRTTNLVGAPYVPVGRMVAVPGSSYQAEKLVPVEPLEGLQIETWVTGTTSSGITNGVNAFTTDVTTYAYNTTSGAISIRRNAAGATVALRFLYSSAVPVTIRAAWRGPSSIVEYTGVFEETDGSQRLAVMLVPKVEGGFDEYLEVEVRASGLSAGDQLRIYNLMALAVNQSALQRIGSSHWRLPAEFAGEVTIPDRILEAKPRVQVTLADSSVVTAKGEAWEYAITRDGGLTTTIRLNQALPAAAESEQAALSSRLERLALRGWGR